MTKLQKQRYKSIFIDMLLLLLVYRVASELATWRYITLVVLCQVIMLWNFHDGLTRWKYIVEEIKEEKGE